MEEIIINSFYGIGDVERISLFSILIISFIFIFTIWFARYHWNRRNDYQMAAQRKGPPTWPIVGNGIAFMGSNEETLKSLLGMMSTYESPFPIWLGPKLFIMLTDPKNFEIVMNSPHALKKETLLYGVIEPVVGLGLFTAPVQQWKKHRKIIMPTFNQKILNSFVEIFSEQAEILTTQLGKVAGTGYFDVFHYFSCLSLDTICETQMGVSVNAQTTANDFVLYLNKGMSICCKRITHIWYNFDFIFNLSKMSDELKTVCEKMVNFTSSVVKQKRDAYLENQKENSEANYENSSRCKNSFLQQLIERSGEGSNLTNQELTDEVITFLIGGTETTATENSFILVLMGLHPDIQERVYKEIVDVLGYDRPVECDDLSKLKYTEMVIKETLRIFPVVPIIGRTITDDIKLDECTLSSGSSVLFGIIHLHRDPKIWPNPLKFDPLRFAPEECAKRHPYSFLPFSGGPRNCVGLKYAMMAMKITIATVLRKYKVTTSYKSIQDIRLTIDIAIKATDGYSIALELRDHYM